MEVASRPKRVSMRAARNLPITNSRVLKGSVDIVSMVPISFSRAIRPIEIAGIKNRKTKGTISNNALRSDCPKRKNRLVKKYPFTMAKITKNI